MPAPTIAFPRAADPYSGLPQADCINAKMLGTAATAETSLVPQGAYAVLFSADDHFVAYIQGAGPVVAAVYPTDIEDGTQKGELNPTLRKLKSTDVQISLVAKSNNVGVTLSYFVKPL